MPLYGVKLPLGRGVETTQILRTSDQFIENQLIKQQSNMSYSEEIEGYMRIAEGLFNENTDDSLSVLIADFWNLWHDIANNPSNAPQRIALAEHSTLLSEKFALLDGNMKQLETDLTISTETALNEINHITQEIAQINEKIVHMEVDRNANDFRDQRNVLLSELAEYINVKAFERENGAMTIISAKGSILVQGDSSYNIYMGGDDGSRVLWPDSSGSNMDITDYITEGRLGGMLDMRDQLLPKYQLDLDALAKSLVWAVNRQHSQGVGLKLFEPNTTLTGTYKTSTDLGDLFFADKIEYVANGFSLWIEDRTDPASPVMTDVPVDLSGLDSSATLNDLADAVNTQIAAAGLTGVTASVSGNAGQFTAGADRAFGFSDDQSNILAALGINTLFQGTTAGSLQVNNVLNDKDFIAAAVIDGAGFYTTGDNTNALQMTDLQYRALEICQWTCDRTRGCTEGNVTTTIEEYYHGMVASLGVVSSSVSRAKAFNETMLNNLSGLRDEMSGVSLDEEMTNLIKYQHAYSAAAKLITISDEMLDTLLSLK
jgi:flagellar hook-associated protein 1 FlgK